MIHQITATPRIVYYDHQGNFKEIPLEDATRDLQFRIFVQLWSIASLFHMAHSSVFDTQLNFALLTICAVYAIFRPSVQSLILVAILQLFDALFRMPYTTNHWIFTAFVNLTILQSLVLLSLSKKSFLIKGSDWMEHFAPAVRIELIILYCFAAFHKLNSGFFASQSSCATDLLLAQHLDSFMPITPEILTFNAYFTVVLEFLIPVLLCFASTRNVALVVGLFFHAVLSYSTYNAFFDFSSMVFALYFLFASPALSVRIYEIFTTWSNTRRAFFQDYNLKKTLVIAASCAAVMVIIYLLNKKIDNYHAVHLYVFWTTFSLFVIYCIISFLMRTKMTNHSSSVSWKISGTMFIFPIIVLLNGLSPYLGLKTENSYAMFSNLKTENGTSNHYIMSASLQVFDYQKDVIDIISSSDPYLTKLALANKSLVMFEFKNIVHERKPYYIEYLHNGESKTFKWENKTDRAELGSNSYILAKLMKFRPFMKEGNQPCSH